MTPLDKTGNNALAVIAKAGKFNKWMYDTISPYAHGNILEIGSGIGNISQFFVKENYHITLSDVDNYYLETLKEKFTQYENVKGFLQIDLQHPSFFQQYAELNSKFDTIFLLNVLEHVEHDENAIKNCKFLLKPGGNLILLVPAYSWLFSKMDRELGHYRRYTLKKATTLLNRTGMIPVKQFYFNFVGIAAWFYGKLFSLRIVPKQEMLFFNQIIPLARIIDKLLFRKAGLSVISITQKSSG